MKYYDAHNHLNDKRLEPYLDFICKEIVKIPVAAMVVNAARENQFEAIGNLSIKYKWIIPAFGVHPWYADKASPNYTENLKRALDKYGGCVGEIGVDTYIKNHNITRQREIFTEQLKIAAEHNLPASIHCVKAWDLLLEILNSTPLPASGILIHSYGGLEPYIEPLVKLGAYFSFAGYFARENKIEQRESFKKIPLNRILVETDAPDQLPPESLIVHPLLEKTTGRPINSPLNLPAIYDYLAHLLNIEKTRFAAIVEENFMRLFGRFLKP